LYIIRLNLKKLSCDRNIFYSELNKLNVGLQVHYIPVYLHPYYQKLGYKAGICPNAEEIFESIITIPLFYGLKNHHVKEIINSIILIVNKYKKSI
jgi:dTDP-4-amino-4,6-dideoxygalactose transaminase